MPWWKTVAIVVTVSAAVVYGTFRAAGVALTANALTISTITVTGTSRMAPGEALAILDGLRGSSMVTADLESWRQKLLDAPWVADASIRRVFPRTVAVVISEREPLGIGRIQNALYLLDQEGSVIDEFGPKYAEFDLPLIDGLAPRAGNPDGSAADQRAILAGRVLADLQRRPDLAQKVAQVDVSNANDAVVVLKDDGVLLHTGDAHFADRVQSYLDLSPRLHEDVPRIDSVDLRFGDNVFVKPQGTTGKQSTAGDQGTASVASAFPPPRKATVGHRSLGEGGRRKK
jgi:cell division protein FtsQ